MDPGELKYYLREKCKIAELINTPVSSLLLDGSEAITEMAPGHYNKMIELEDKNKQLSKQNILLIGADMIRNACHSLIGKNFELKCANNLSGTFVIQKKWIDMLCYYEPIEYNDSLWIQVSNISWGQGYHSVLYYDGVNDLIAVNDELTVNSEIIMRYSL